jgi:hypothetical protein
LDDKRDEQTTPWSNPAQWRLIDADAWRHIVSVSMGRRLSTWASLKVRTETYHDSSSPTSALACEFTDLERMQWLPSDLARVVVGIIEMQELVFDQTVVGKSGAQFFQRLANPFVRVSITPPAGEGGGGHFYEIPRTELVNSLVSVLQDQRVRVDLRGSGVSSAELEAEIKAARETEEHSDMLTAVAVALWYVCTHRQRLGRGNQPPPRVHLRRSR